MGCLMQIVRWFFLARILSFASRVIGGILRGIARR
jgi:hypothetical protein